MADTYITNTAEAIMGLNTDVGDMQTRITALEVDVADAQTRITALETEVARLEADKLDIADAIATFSFAAYADLTAPDNSVFPDLDATYQKINVLTQSSIVGRGINVDTVNSTFSFTYDGVYQFTVTGSMLHDLSQSGRAFGLRIYNETTATPGGGIVIGSGRNLQVTQINVSFLAEISDTEKGDVISLQIGGIDAYSTVSFQTLGVALNAESEWREPLG